MATEIYLYGEFGWEITAQSVKDQLDGINLAETDELTVRYFSPGGSVREGFAIKNMLLATGKKLTSIADGLVGSIATIPFLAAETRLMSEDTEFFIHNPSAGAWGTEAELTKVIEQLAEMRTQILDYYQKRTGLTHATLTPFMDEETFFTPAQAVEMGFATGTIELSPAVAHMVMMLRKKDKSNKSEMDEKRTETLLNKAVNRFASLIAGPKSLQLANQIGEILIVNTKENDAQEGDAVQIEGKELENGPMIMQDGRTFHIEAGKISRIDPAPEMVPVDQVETMIEQLTEKMVEKFSALLEEQNQQIKAQETQIFNLKAEIASSYQPPRPDAFQQEGDNLVTKADLKRDFQSILNEKSNQRKNGKN